jgi:WhiB family transcriptional regulator, redox-sensing transcriptional regulator
MTHEHLPRQARHKEIVTRARASALHRADSAATEDASAPASPANISELCREYSGPCELSGCGSRERTNGRADALTAGLAGEQAAVGTAWRWRRCPDCNQTIPRAAASGPAGGQPPSARRPRVPASRSGGPWSAGDADWRRGAACLSADPELFFPISYTGASLQQVAAAKAICAGCPVRRECLAFAQRGEPHGIWGGLTEQERESASRAARHRQ